MLMILIRYNFHNFCITRKNVKKLKPQIESNKNLNITLMHTKQIILMSRSKVKIILSGTIPREGQRSVA